MAWLHTAFHGPCLLTSSAPFFPASSFPILFFPFCPWITVLPCLVLFGQGNESEELKSEGGK